MSKETRSDEAADSDGDDYRFYMRRNAEELLRAETCEESVANVHFQMAAIYAVKAQAVGGGGAGKLGMAEGGEQRH